MCVCQQSNLQPGSPPVGRSVFKEEAGPDVIPSCGNPFPRPSRSLSVSLTLKLQRVPGVTDAELNR